MVTKRSQKLPHQDEIVQNEFLDFIIERMKTCSVVPASVAIAPSTNILAFTDKVAELSSALCGRMIGFPPEMLCNMDQTAVYFDPSSNKSIAPKGSKDVSVRQNQGVSSRVTVCLTVFGDGTKLTKSPVKFWKAFTHSFRKKTHNTTRLTIFNSSYCTLRFQFVFNSYYFTFQKHHKPDFTQSIATACMIGMCGTSSAIGG
jgi:hypothetical protein